MRSICNLLLDHLYSLSVNYRAPEGVRTLDYLEPIEESLIDTLNLIKKTHEHDLSSLIQISCQSDAYSFQSTISSLFMSTETIVNGFLQNLFQILQSHRENRLGKNTLKFQFKIYHAKSKKLQKIYEAKAMKHARKSGLLNQRRSSLSPRSLSASQLAGPSNVAGPSGLQAAAKTPPLSASQTSEELKGVPKGCSKDEWNSLFFNPCYEHDIYKQTCISQLKEKCLVSAFSLALEWVTINEKFEDSPEKAFFKNILQQKQLSQNQKEYVLQIITKILDKIGKTNSNDAINFSDLSTIIEEENIQLYVLLASKPTQIVHQHPCNGNAARKPIILLLHCDPVLASSHCTYVYDYKNFFKLSKTKLCFVCSKTLKSNKLHLCNNFKQKFCFFCKALALRNKPYNNSLLDLHCDSKTMPKVIANTEVATCSKYKHCNICKKTVVGAGETCFQNHISICSQLHWCALGNHYALKHSSRSCHEKNDSALQSNGCSAQNYCPVSKRKGLKRKCKICHELFVLPLKHQRDVGGSYHCCKIKPPAKEVRLNLAFCQIAFFEKKPINIRFLYENKNSGCFDELSFSDNDSDFFAPQIFEFQYLPPGMQKMPTKKFKQKIAVPQYVIARHRMSKLKGDSPINRFLKWFIANELRRYCIIISTEKELVRCLRNKLSFKVTFTYLLQEFLLETFRRNFFHATVGSAPLRTITIENLLTKFVLGSCYLHP